MDRERPVNRVLTLSSLRRTRLYFVSLLAAFAWLMVAVPATAETLYKSTARDGGITYSDRPQSNALRVETIVVTRPAAPVDAPRARVYNDRRGRADAATQQANETLNDAERALAVGRRLLWVKTSGLMNADLRVNEVDYERIEALKADVGEARQALFKAIRQRNALG